MIVMAYDGLTMIVLPVNSAGATFPTERMRGKFQGIIAAKG